MQKWWEIEVRKEKKKINLVTDKGICTPSQQGTVGFEKKEMRLEGRSDGDGRGKIIWDLRLLRVAYSATSSTGGSVVCPAWFDLSSVGATSTGLTSGFVT